MDNDSEFERIMLTLQAHNDDITQILILNKKVIANHEHELFKTELEKFRPYQSRLLQASHKQAALMKELTTSFNVLLQDKRVRSEQSRYEAMTRQRAAVLTKYKRIYHEFLDLQAGVAAAKNWYSEMQDTVNSLEKNVEAFVNNRRSEGAQLLHQIEKDRASSSDGRGDKDRDRLKSLMERMSIDPSGTSSPARSPISRGQVSVSPSNPYGSYQSSSTSPDSYHNPSLPYAPQSMGYHGQAMQQRGDPRQTGKPDLRIQSSYDPSSFARLDYGQPVSPPPSQQHFSPNAQSSYNLPAQTPIQHQYMPAGFVPPPPPPGPPPLGPQQTFSPVSGNYPPNANRDGYQLPNNRQGQSSADPWAGLNSWR
jgi:hypothetical protein